MKIKSYLTTFLCSFSFAAMTSAPDVFNCSSEFSIRLQNAHENAVLMFDKLEMKKEEVYKALVEQFDVASSEKIKREFLSIMTCVNKKLKAGSYAYRCAEGSVCDSALAYIRGGDTLLNHVLGLGSVKMCEEKYYSYRDNFLESVIVHEVSHLCTTDDKSYFDGLYAKDMKKKNWPKNADSYFNIYQNHFSLL